MTRPDLTDDDVLISVLRDSLNEVDPVPDDAISFAKSVARLSDLDAISCARSVARLSDLDAELATLVADSLVDDVVLFRHDLTMEPQGEGVDRLVTFATPQLSVDIDLQAGRATVLGVITPPISVEVDLETTKGTRTTTSDELGRFQFEAGGSLCRLRIHAHDGAVITPWITR